MTTNPVLILKFPLRVIILGLALLGCVSLNASEWQMLPMPGQPQAKPFTLPGMDGKLHSLSDYHDKFILVNFWNNDCGICRHEMSSLHHHNKTMASKEYEVVAIHAGPGEEQIRETLELNPVDYTILIDRDLTMGNWNIPSLPTSYLVSPKGKLLYRYVGPRDWTSPAMMEFLEHVMQNDDSEAELRITPSKSQNSKPNTSMSDETGKSVL